MSLICPHALQSCPTSASSNLEWRRRTVTTRHSYPVYRDERTTAVELASDRLAWLVVSYGLLVIIAYRAFAHGESSWDLFALILLGEAVSTGYQARHRVLGRRWAVVTLMTVVAAGVLAAVVAVLLRTR